VSATPDNDNRKLCCVWFHTDGPDNANLFSTCSAAGLQKSLLRRGNNLHIQVRRAAPCPKWSSIIFVKEMREVTMGELATRDWLCNTEGCGSLFLVHWEMHTRACSALDRRSNFPLA
jgi:hypothetical protein